jgi:hypothetical protein
VHQVDDAVQNIWIGLREDAVTKVEDVPSAPAAAEHVFRRVFHQRPFGQADGRIEVPL